MGNQAVVGLPNGRFSDGGGIASGGMLKLQDSVVSGNSSNVEAAVPSSFFSGEPDKRQMRAASTCKTARRRRSSARRSATTASLGATRWVTRMPRPAVSTPTARCS